MTGININRFLIAIVCSLALLSIGAYYIVRNAMLEWSEKDIQLRAQLAVSGARQMLISGLLKRDTSGLEAALIEITHDERIMGAAAYAADMTALAKTPDYPEVFTSEHIGSNIRPINNDARSLSWTSWYSVASIKGGDVHVSAVPVFEQDQPVGFIVLVHDLSYIERRDAKILRFLLLAFIFLTIATSAVTILAARWSWQGWNKELQRLLRGETRRPEFQPFLRDVRELVDRIVAEKDADWEGGTWTPPRLKNALTRYLHGEKIVIVANREPYIHERTDDGSIKVVHPASGLVTALEPIMRACSGVWIAHGGGSADRETVDMSDRVMVPPGEDSYSLRRVWLTPEEERGYYYGFSNEGLWPLCHLAHERPMFKSEDWKHYQIVNRRFADAVCAEVDSDDPLILVQDYHFALAPMFIRERLPRSTVIMFWHIPWPNSERFGICPWRNELLDGMLGSSIIGFHTQHHCNNFVDSIDRFLEARIDRAQTAIVRNEKTTMIRPYPISLEWPPRWLKDIPSVEECRASVIKDIDLTPDALIGIGVDRLDYTKGIEERLLAVERLLERFPAFQGRFTFVQLAAPSRTIIERYRQLSERVEKITARINERFGKGSYRPIVLLCSHHEPPTVFRYYRAADFCYVSSLHDGMNLVAKEFVAAREDERGVLVLSRFAGAARELTEALIVNPYDIDEASLAIATALNMSAGEQRDRMRAMRTFVSEFNVYRWAGRMIIDAARLRRRDRLTFRLTDYLESATATH
ncbi:MAG: trehalose-6-phosphate synthase [Pseudomonadota bacterium]